MSASLVGRYLSFIRGLRLIDGGDLLNFANSVQGVNAGVTALAGGGTGTGVPILALGLNQLSVVATNNDSVELPPAIPGATLVVINDGAATVEIYPTQSNPANGNVADTIAPYNSVVYGANVTSATATVSVFYCAVIGKWKQTLQS